MEVGGPVDDDILCALIQLGEVGHITGHADHQALVLLRIDLGIAKGLIVNDVDLDMLAQS